MNGLAMQARMRDRHSDSQVVIITGHFNIELMVHAFKWCLFEFH